MKVIRMMLMGALVFSSLSVFADRPRYLGQVRISKTTDTDRVDVRSCAQHDEYVTAIRLHVLNGAVDIYRLVAKFGDGDAAIARFAGRWFGGDSSGWIYFDRPRCLRQLVITANGANSRPRVEFWGMTRPR